MIDHDKVSPDTVSPDTVDLDATHRPASTALTVVEGSDDADRRFGERRSSDRQRPRTFRIVHPDASFVTQLIATAAQLPQTRGLRRASPEDAQTSYRAAAHTAAVRSASDPHATVRVA